MSDDRNNFDPQILRDGIIKKYGRREFRKRNDQIYGTLIQGKKL
jgi:hypothetical protein